MDKEEPFGIADPISIDFSQRVHEALKPRKKNQQAPWTIDGPGESDWNREQPDNESQSLREYRRFGEWIHPLAPRLDAENRHVLESLSMRETAESRPLVEDGAGWLIRTSARDASVKLRVGLASDYPELFEIAFDIYAACADARAREHGGSFQIDIDKPGSRDKVYGKFFANCSDYHIIMIDDPWIPEFEPLLLDLRQLPFKEFKDSKLLEELFFQPVFEVCKFPIDSGKLCGLPILGDVNFLCYDTTAADNERVTDLLDGSVIDPDRLKREIQGEHRNGTNIRDETRSWCKMPFVVRNLDDEDLVEGFWLLMRGYGLEDVYRPHHDGEITIPRIWRSCPPTGCTKSTPNGTGDLTRWRITDNMIAGDRARHDLRLAKYDHSQGKNDPLDRQADRFAPVRSPGALRNPGTGDPRGSGREREQIEAAMAIPDANDQLADSIHPGGPGQYPCPK